MKLPVTEIIIFTVKQIILIFVITIGIITIAKILQPIHQNRNLYNELIALQMKYDSLETVYHAEVTKNRNERIIVKRAILEQANHCYKCRELYERLRYAYE